MDPKGWPAAVLHHLALPLEPGDVGWDLSQQLDLGSVLSTPTARQPSGLQASQKQLTLVSAVEKGELKCAPGVGQETQITAHAAGVLDPAEGRYKAGAWHVQLSLQYLHPRKMRTRRKEIYGYFYNLAVLNFPLVCTMVGREEGVIKPGAFAVGLEYPCGVVWNLQHPVHSPLLAGRLTGIVQASNPSSDGREERAGKNLVSLRSCM